MLSYITSPSVGIFPPCYFFSCLSCSSDNYRWLWSSSFSAAFVFLGLSYVRQSVVFYSDHVFSIIRFYHLPAYTRCILFDLRKKHFKGAWFRSRKIVHNKLSYSYRKSTTFSTLPGKKGLIDPDANSLSAMSARRLYLVFLPVSTEFTDFSRPFPGFC